MNDFLRPLPDDPGADYVEAMLDVRDAEWLLTSRVVVIAWLRRLWAARRVTVADVEQGHAQVRAATDRLGEVLDRAFPPGTFERIDRQTVADAIRTAPCEPTRVPDLVARTKANRAAHYRAHGEDPDADWGPWVNPYDEPGSAA